MKILWKIITEALFQKTDYFVIPLACGSKKKGENPHGQNNIQENECVLSKKQRKVLNFALFNIIQNLFVYWFLGHLCMSYTFWIRCFQFLDTFVFSYVQNWGKTKTDILQLWILSELLNLFYSKSCTF